MQWLGISLAVLGLVGTAVGGYVYYSDKGIPLDSGILNGWEWTVRMKPEGYCAYFVRPGFPAQLLVCDDNRTAAKGKVLEFIYGETEGVGRVQPVRAIATESLSLNLPPLPNLAGEGIAVNWGG